ncbi:MAG: Asp/Glu racemase [Pseudomonadota bacterium]
MNSTPQLPHLAPDGWGSLARIGLVTLHTSVVIENEMQAMAAPGVSVHSSRIRIGKINVADIGAMVESDGFETAVSLIAEAPVDVVVFGGTSASFLHGNAWDEMTTARMQKMGAGTPAITTATACIRALSHLGVGKVALATPYLPEVHERCAAWLGANGHPVTNGRYLSISRDQELAEVSLEAVWELCLSVDTPDAEAIFISCTNFRSIALIAALEERLGKPVVSAVQASMWGALDRIGVMGATPGYGRLMQSVEMAAQRRAAS